MNMRFLLRDDKNFLKLNHGQVCWTLQKYFKTIELCTINVNYVFKNVSLHLLSAYHKVSRCLVHNAVGLRHTVKHKKISNHPDYYSFNTLCLKNNTVIPLHNLQVNQLAKLASCPSPLEDSECFQQVGKLLWRIPGCF